MSSCWWFKNRFYFSREEKTMDKSSASNSPSEPQPHNSLYQKLDQVETRRQLKLSFPLPTGEKTKPIPVKVVQPIPVLNPRWITRNSANSRLSNLFLSSFYLQPRRAIQSTWTGKVAILPHRNLRFYIRGPSRSRWNWARSLRQCQQNDLQAYRQSHGG